MKTSPFLVNLIIYGPYILLLILFLIFFYRAIRFHGITKLKKFTVGMLGVFVIAFALRYFKLNFFDWVPIQFLKVAGTGNTTILLILLMMIFFAMSIAKIRTEKKARFLSLNWLLICLFSVAYIFWLVYLYMLWKEPTGRAAYMKQMIYPLLWVLVSGISLWKIKKEKRRLIYA
ncbi:hypothetical protein A4H97_13875 [Niastella yeongjuensis]|uniref:Uncharacterized protein n=1 Tax=Niastella yeongjuensis TaxID=354355 RepID=A0A1V9E3M5_9BACT|nr:hypothetical protein [Niastella yeongjuensis]OQP40708.1 hypothetical protein A4H97_13875 [Niastella yeongjuensis]SEP04035.1 hypothetical protein SAMN05660816_04283 [Niastella yeongjuensis]